MKNISKNIFLVIAVTLVQYNISIAQEPVLTMTLGHVSPVMDMSISPDGKYLFSRSNDAIKLWDITSGRELRTLTDIKGYDISFSPDGKYFVMGGNKNTLEIRNVETSEIIKTFEGKEGTLCRALFSPDGKQIASLERDDIIVLWDIETGTRIKSFLGHTGSISMFKFSLDGKQLLSGGADYTMKLWDVATGELLNSFDNKGKILKAVDFSSDGKYLLAAGFDKEIKLFDAKTFKKLKTFKGHEDRITTACFSPDGKYILSGGFDNKVMLWEVPTGKMVKTFDRHYHIVSKVCFTPDGKQIITAGWDKNIFVWDIQTGKMVKSLTGLFYPVYSACFSKNDEFALIGSGTYARLWDFKNGKSLKTFRGHNHIVTSCDFSSDNRKVITGSLDKTVKVWSVMLGSELKTLSGHTKEIYSVAFSPDDKTIASGGDNMLLWDASTGAKMKDFKVGKSEVISVHFSPKGDRIFSGTRDENIPIKIWDTEQGTELKTFVGSEKGIFSINYSPDGKFGFFTSYNGDIKVFSTETGDEIQVLKANLSWECMACFSPDSKTIASQSRDQKIVIWDIATGKISKKFDTKTGIVKNISYFDQGKKLLTINDNKSVKIWDVQSGKELCTMYNLFYTDWIVVTPDGKFDGTEEGMKQLYYVKNLEFIPLESLFENYYTPKLLTKILNDEILPSSIVTVSQLKPAPDVKIVSPDNGSTVNQEQVKITVKATDQGGGIDEVRLYHNGKLLDGTTRGFKSTGQNHEFTVTLTNGENRIKATAFNSQRTESIPDEIVVYYKAPEIVKPNMHILAIGINNYLNPKYNLNYAKNDTEAFVKSFSAGASSLFGKVEVTTINDADATKTGILAAVEKIKSASKAEDVFVFYYAGHGVMSSGNGVEKPLFYLVPHDVTKMYEADEILKKSGISATEIGEFSKTIKAQKQLFVIDACQSGGAMQTLAMRGASEEKAIAQLARSTGTYFIAASGTEQFATEVAELGHGIFTYSVIEALKGSCKSQDGKVTVNLLKSCVEDLVPELSKKHKGQPQFPTGYGFGMDFPVVMVK